MTRPKGSFRDRFPEGMVIEGWHHSFVVPDYLRTEDEAIEAFGPLVEPALRSFEIDVSYFTQMVTASRRIEGFQRRAVDTSGDGQVPRP